MELLFEEHRNIIENEICTVKNTLNILLNDKNELHKLENLVKNLEKRITELEKTKKEFYFLNNKFGKLLKVISDKVDSETVLNKELLSLKNKVYNDNIMTIKYTHTVLIIGLVVLFVVERGFQFLI